MVVVSSACGRIAAAGALVVTVIVSGAIARPQAIDSVGLLEAADDPVQMTELRLPSVATEQRTALEIEDALSKSGLNYMEAGNRGSESYQAESQLKCQFPGCAPKH